jgi:Clostripain family
MPYYSRECQGTTSGNTTLFQEGFALRRINSWHNVARVALGIVFAGAFSMSGSPAWAAEWTVMIYMNAKNNLESDAINNFYSMATVGSTSQINIVAELGRPQNHYTNSNGGWSGVRRFLITRTTRPIQSDAISDPSKEGQSTDMGSPQALSDFMDWSMARFPAKRYMLIIWNHGQGWRFQLADDRRLKTAAASRSTAETRTTLAAALPTVPPMNGYKSVSLDEDSGNILFNSDIQAALETKFSSRKLDLIGFDACLMSMIETAFAFRNLARIMIGSEELEPGEGWQYQGWLKRLVDEPSLDARGVAKAVVDSYRARYGNTFLTTLSAVDLEQAAGVADSVSTLGRLLIARLSQQARTLRSVRSKLTPYGQDANLNTSIDLDYFLELFGKTTKDAELLQAVKITRANIANMVFTNYASARELSSYGSRGIAVYFPASRANFLSDRDHNGYLKNNADHPVEFVKKEAWADFIAAYLR